MRSSCPVYLASEGVADAVVPLACQKQPTKTGNHEHSRDIRPTPELPVPSSRGWWRQPDPKIGELVGARQHPAGRQRSRVRFAAEGQAAGSRVTL
jgi:hypothetical protein